MAPTNAGSVESDAIDFRQIQDFFWRRWKLVLATTATVMILAFLVLLTLTPRYTATAQVLLEPRKEKIFGAETIVPELSIDNASVESQVSVIQSANLLRRVVEKEHLFQDPEFGYHPPAGFWGFVNGLSQSFGAFFKASAVNKNAAQSVDQKQDSPISPFVLYSIGRLQKAVEVQRLKGALVLSIAVTSEDPAKAARLANAVADAFVVDQLEARYDAAKRASTWLAERLEDLGAQVRVSEEAVANFRKEHNLIAASSEGKVTISDQQQSELSARLITARAETAEKRAKYEQAAQVATRGGNLQAIPDVVRSPVITRLRDQQAEIARKEADLTAHYSAQHPSVINIRAERRDLERSIAAEVQRILINLKNDLDVAKVREDSLQASLTQATGRTGLEDNVGVRLRELERINTANKTFFDNFVARSKATQEQSQFEEREARVISPAFKAGSPSFPKIPLLEALAGGLGLLLGIGGAVALDMLNSGFTTAREIEDKLRRPVLASVPILSQSDRRIDDKSLDPTRYLIAKPLSRYAEAVRAIRMGIQMSDVDHPAKVVLVTSSIPQEGKSTLAQSLAFSAAKAGQKVLLVDGDLRHPSMSKYFGMETKPGLVELLTGATKLEEIIMPQGGVSVLSAGAKSHNPPDLLGSERMKFFVEQWRSSFDYIIIDSPPMGAVIDAKVLVALADKVVFIVRWRDTEREMVAEHVEYLTSNEKLAGIALNMVDESQISRAGSYAHHSGHHYKKYYDN